MNEHQWYSEVHDAAVAAAKRIGLPEGWKPFCYEVAANGILVDGAVCFQITRGVNKGQWSSRGCKVTRILVIARPGLGHTPEFCA